MWPDHESVPGETCGALCRAVAQHAVTASGLRGSAWLVSHKVQLDPREAGVFWNGVEAAAQSARHAERCSVVRQNVAQTSRAPRARA